VEKVECVVVGAGVIGLAVARALALAGREVVVLEAAEAIGTETSSRNSEVIHAGIYYPQGSLKARLCVRGKALLYDYCDTRGVGYRRCGKLILASETRQLPALDAISEKAAANGVHDLQRLKAEEVAELEPALRCVGALLSPSTGIIDSHELMLAYLGEAEASGAALALLSPVLGGRIEGDGISLQVGGREPCQLRTAILVNAAGLHAPSVATGLLGLPPEAVPAYRYAKGSYYTLAGRVPMRHLVYPVPEDAGLGVHLTLDLTGQARFGPDVEWVDHIDYRVDPRRADNFYAAVRRYWPELPDEALHPAYAGIRPKLHGPGEAAADFVIVGPESHGISGLINLFGIESPGLTASLAIAEEVLQRLHLDPPLQAQG
jgi:L-2-hydroxyglutarate oxidase LhgO